MFVYRKNMYTHTYYRVLGRTVRFSENHKTWVSTLVFQHFPSPETVRQNRPTVARDERLDGRVGHDVIAITTVRRLLCRFRVKRKIAERCNAGTAELFRYYVKAFGGL